MGYLTLFQQSDLLIKSFIFKIVFSVQICHLKKYCLLEASKCDRISMRTENYASLIDATQALNSEAFCGGNLW